MQTGINVRPGSQSEVSIEREFFTKLEEPYSDCLDDLYSPPNEYSKILFGYFQKLNVTEYDKKFCELLCFQDKLIDQCNCSDISTPKLSNKSYCLSDTELNCMQKFNSYFKSVNTYKNCGYACPEKCFSIKYNLKQTSKARITNSNYVRKLQSSDKTSKLFPHYGNSDFMITNAEMRALYDSGENQYNPEYVSQIENITDIELMDYIDQGYLRLTINYDSLYRTEINEQATVSTFDVYNFIGQQIGIYLDASMLTMAEFPVFLVMIIADIFLHCKNLWNQ